MGVMPKLIFINNDLKVEIRCKRLKIGSSGEFWVLLKHGIEVMPKLVII
jgi:hypothetical protein